MASRSIRQPENQFATAICCLSFYDNYVPCSCIRIILLLNDNRNNIVNLILQMLHALRRVDGTKVPLSCTERCWAMGVIKTHAHFPDSILILRMAMTPPICIRPHHRQVIFACGQYYAVEI